MKGEKGKGEEGTRVEDEKWRKREERRGDTPSNLLEGTTGTISDLLAGVTVEGVARLLGYEVECFGSLVTIHCIPPVPSRERRQGKGGEREPYLYHHNPPVHQQQHLP